MKKLIAFILAAVMCAAFTITAFAAEYSFNSGPDTSETFGKPTGYDAAVTPDPMTENTRRNKDAAYNPPSYGVFSGNIPTDQSSLYHDNTPPYAGYTGNSTSKLDYVYNGGVSDVGVDYGGSSGAVSVDYSTILPSTSAYESDSYFTAPLYYDDGSIGTLSIPKLGITVKVYEGETLDNMRVGLGHFEFTSAWDGNCSFAGHNRGVPAAIGKIKDLVNGDKIIYETKYGTRTYEVYSKQKISDTDYSGLGWSSENIISMVTCVENESAYRWLLQARQVG